MKSGGGSRSYSGSSFVVCCCTVLENKAVTVRETIKYVSVLLTGNIQYGHVEA